MLVVGGRVAVPVPVDYLLEREGVVFPGSLEGGCFIALQDL